MSLLKFHKTLFLSLSLGTMSTSCNNGNCKCRLSSWGSWSACCKSGGGTISDVSTRKRRILDSEPCDNNERLEQSKYCPKCPFVYNSEFTCHKSGGKCINCLIMPLIIDQMQWTLTRKYSKNLEYSKILNSNIKYSNSTQINKFEGELILD